MQSRLPVPSRAGERAAGQRRQTVFVVVLALVLEETGTAISIPALSARSLHAAMACSSRTMDIPFPTLLIKGFPQESRFLLFTQADMALPPAPYPISFPIHAAC